MSASEAYYRQEEGIKFKDWAKGGLEFLLMNYTDVLTTSQIALIEKKLAKLYLKEKREMPFKTTYSFHLPQTHNKDTKQ
ncbi:hypothetical protein [Candidatus Sulfurimonas baltica]|uniref:Uncharacterized protein n=1 Tax=Candidatus Sulfurimonas baltica TaxID=2740404 RepID=A0A7S7RLP7_9BACT|nr:hypothetical protein [Candidatus Sulfurimonas baltica]QOY51357.1 hypothetical protein HUE88_09520 [Candidatus Sulfurimonas baltica]